MQRPALRIIAAFAALLGGAFSPAGAADEDDRIADLLALSPGQVVADVGAGDGEFGEAMAARVGPAGRVYITEVDDGELRKIRNRVEDSDLANMIVVEGAAADTMLPENCCTAILLRLVYHHASLREELAASLLRSLAPGGRMLVIETDQSDHGLPEDELIQELTAGGFQVVSRHADWEGDSDDYAVVFRRQDE